MKIDKNITFLKSVAGTSIPVSAKGGAHGSVSEVAGAPLLPSTQGDFDAARVARIRENISAGRYQINTGKIADGLLASVRELLGKKTP